MADPSKVGMEKNFYEETYWEKAAKTRMGNYLSRMETDFIFKSITPSQICTVMNAGAEAGRFSSIASEKNATVIGIPFLALFEKLFPSRRIPSLSPWVIVHSIKSEKNSLTKL